MFQPDYFTVALTESRRHLLKLAAQTHWIDYDAPVTRGQAQASCGSIVDVRKFSQSPTCVACQQQKAIADAFQF